MPEEKVYDPGVDDYGRNRKKEKEKLLTTLEEYDNKEAEKPDIDPKTFASKDGFILSIMPDVNIYETNGNGAHRHHHKLSKKINEITDAINDNSEEIRVLTNCIEFLLSMIPDDIMEEALEKWKDYIDQQKYVKEQEKILVEKEKKMYKLIIKK